MVFYFTGTGNSLWVADALGKELGEPLISLAAELKKEEAVLTYALRTDEPILFVYPVHSWGPALPVVRFISRLAFVGYDRQPVYSVCTCGDECGYTLGKMRKALARRGLSLTAGYSVQMPNNYILLPGFSVDSPEVEKEKLAKAPERVAAILRQIKAEISDAKIAAPAGTVEAVETVVAVETVEAAAAGCGIVNAASASASGTVAGVDVCGASGSVEVAAAAADCGIVNAAAFGTFRTVEKGDAVNASQTIEAVDAANVSSAGNIANVANIGNASEASSETLYRQGSFPFLKSCLIYPLFANFAVGKNAFYATDACISCGLCARICPTETIVWSEGSRPRWGDTCVQCVACIHRCPARAIEYGRQTQKKGRYCHPQLSKLNKTDK